MRPPVVVFLAVLFALLQVSLLDYFRFFQVKPDLLLVSVFLGSLFLEPKAAVILGAAAGLFKDIFSLTPPGLNALLFLAWVILVIKLTRRVSLEDNLSRAILILAIALLNNAASGMTLIYAGAYLPLGIFLRIVVISSVYTALVFYLIAGIKIRWLGLRY